MTDTQPTAAVVTSDHVPADTRRGGEIRTLLSPRTVGSTSGLMGVARIPPGEWIAEHYHPYSEEFVFVVAGTLGAELDGDRQQVAASSALHIPANVRHRLRNVGDDDVQLVFHLGPLAPRPEVGHVDTEVREAASAPAGAKDHA